MKTTTAWQSSSTTAEMATSVSVSLALRTSQVQYVLDLCVHFFFILCLCYFLCMFLIEHNVFIFVGDELSFSLIATLIHWSLLRMYIYSRGLCEVGKCSPISLAEKRRRVFMNMDIILNWFHTTSIRNDLVGAGGWMRTDRGSEIQLNICTWNWIHKTQWEVWWGTLELDQLDDGAALTWSKSL